MKNPLLIVGLMLATAAALIGAVIVLGKQSQENFVDNATGLNLPTAFPAKESKTTPEERPVASETGPWPKAAFDETRYAFGKMAVNSKNQHTFVIRNDGEADLIMKEGQPTCKCTTFSLDSRVVKPGEETKLVIDWKAGPGPDRAFHHGGDVYTNDPKNSQINFGVEGKIEMPVEMLPNFWNIGKINRDQTGTLQATIGSPLSDQLEIESVESPSGTAIVKVSPMNIEELAAAEWVKGFRLDVEIAADIPGGKFEEDVKINIKGVDQVPFVTAKLTASKYGSVILQPLDGTLFVPDKLLLQLGQFPASEGRNAKLLAIVEEKDMTEPFRIIDVEADPPFLKASLKPLGIPTGTVHRYAVEIIVPPGRPLVEKTMARRGHITIRTNLPSNESIFTDVLMHSH